MPLSGRSPRRPLTQIPRPRRRSQISRLALPAGNTLNRTQTRPVFSVFRGENGPFCLTLGGVAVGKASEFTPNSAAPSQRTISGQRARAPSEARTNWGRNVLKGRAAIRAAFLRLLLDAKPLATRGTSRIQTLHRPTGEILHPVFSCLERLCGRGKSRLLPRNKRTSHKKRENCAPRLLVCQGHLPTITRGAVANPVENPIQPRAPATHSIFRSHANSRKVFCR